MNVNVTKELARLQHMSLQDLRAKHRDVFGEATGSGNRLFLLKRISYRMQAVAEGDLTERAKRRAAELANDADLRRSVPKSPTPSYHIDQPVVSAKLTTTPGLPPPGAILTRMYKGKAIQVSVLPSGFDYEGEVYKSLSAIARKVTGTQWNGWLFFGLKGGK